MDILQAIGTCMIIGSTTTAAIYNMGKNRLPVVHLSLSTQYLSTERIREGYRYLRIRVGYRANTPEGYCIKFIRVKGAKIATKISDDSDVWIADQVDSSVGRSWGFCSAYLPAPVDEGFKDYDLLIKPDDPQGVLTLLVVTSTLGFLKRKLKYKIQTADGSVGFQPQPKATDSP